MCVLCGGEFYHTIQSWLVTGPAFHPYSKTAHKYESSQHEWNLTPFQKGFSFSSLENLVLKRRAQDLAIEMNMDPLMHSKAGTGQTCTHMYFRTTVVTIYGFLSIVMKHIMSR